MQKAFNVFLVVVFRSFYFSYERKATVILLSSAILYCTQLIIINFDLLHIKAKKEKHFCCYIYSKISTKKSETRKKNKIK